ncbi:MAG: hypothetical protein RL145_608 [Pseudomonadota bacterium]|jgi:hypothetical protein
MEEGRNVEKRPDLLFPPIQGGARPNPIQSGCKKLRSSSKTTQDIRSELNSFRVCSVNGLHHDQAIAELVDAEQRPKHLERFKAALRLP